MLAALVLGLGIPTLATAQLGPTNIPAPLTQTDDSDDAVQVDDEGGLTTLQLVLIFGGAIGVIVAIGWVIMRDARRAAPAVGRSRVAQPAGGAPKAKSAREREREKARKRAKAKAARDQRKRNRPR
jgi:hypothetical protein